MIMDPLTSGNIQRIILVLEARGAENIVVDDALDFGPGRHEISFEFTLDTRESEYWNVVVCGDEVSYLVELDEGPVHAWYTKTTFPSFRAYVLPTIPLAAEHHPTRPLAGYAA